MGPDGPRSAHKAVQKIGSMNSNDKKRDAGPRLCLEIAITHGGNAVPMLQAALSETGIAAVIMSPAPDGRIDNKTAGPVVKLIQSHNAAALIKSDVDLARKLEADGVHIPWSEDIEDVFKSARNALGPTFIVGGEAGTSRHTAMCLGEAGADYVAFGLETGPADNESTPATPPDLCSWWSDLFEVPGMAMGIERPEDAATLADAGIDFISVKINAATTPADIKDHVARVAAIVPGSQPVA